MATVKDEINSIYDFLKTMYSTATIARQDVPSQPTANTFVIRSQYESTTKETALSALSGREYQLIYYGTSSLDALAKKDEIAKALLNADYAIQIRGSDRYIRVRGFNFGTVYTSANGVPYIFGVMQTESRDARELPTYKTVAGIDTSVKQGE